MTGVPVPPWWGVALSLVLVGAAAAVIYRERLGLARELAVATVRAAVQLIAVGAALRVVFEHAGVPGSLGWVGGMVVLAGRTAGRRARGLPGGGRVATIGVAVATAATLGLLVGAQVVSSSPRVVVPLGGMVVNAAMQGASMALARVRDEVTAGRAYVEARLVLGFSGATAFAPYERVALRTALEPVIDQTKVVGLITLPGAMTGLIIAGVPPLLAIRYQIVVMYMFVGAAAIAALVSVRLARRLLFDDAHRLKHLAP